jgi:hypothetical protein
MVSFISKVIQDERYKNSKRLYLKSRITKMEVGGGGGGGDGGVWGSPF